MDWQLLVLALEAALYPTLLAAMVILLTTPRPRQLVGAYLAGGLTISIGLGLVFVFVIKGSNTDTSSGSTLSWGADLAIGGLALLLAVALATRADERARERRRERREAAGKVKPPKAKDNQEPWSQRILARGSVPIVFAAALAINVPGAAYLIGLKDIAGGHHSAGTEVALVVGFNLIMFALAEIPLAGLLIAPEKTTDLVKRANGWLSGHGRQIAIGLCAILGVFLVVRGIINS
ncbi:MAG: GAP family protein [Solirubrobacteraceae bacterium]